MDIITKLSYKPFVHIIAQARSGSSALYDALQWPSDNIDPKISKQSYPDRSKDLSEPLKGPINKTLFNKVLSMVKDHEKHELTTMKNLLPDILKYDKRLQNKMFRLPVYTVGLLRRNTFEQTCSDILHDLDGWVHIGEATKMHEIDRNKFVQTLMAVVREKKNMLNYARHYDEIIYYEDIVYPSHIISTLSPPKQSRIANYHEVKQWYHELMHSWKHQKTVQVSGIKWHIDKTNTHKA